jgi:molecular chaperone DnaK (HSP70)
MAAPIITRPRANLERARKRLHVSIDFGTTTSGFAYAADNGSTGSVVVRDFSAYPDQLVPYPKTKTALLYKNGQPEPVAWGWTAHKQYLALGAAERSSYTYIEQFKLALDRRSRCQLPDGFTAERVVGDYLRLLKRYAVERLQEAYGAGTHEDLVQWCVTVPAMWSEEQKAVMRRAALAAGVIRELHSDALMIILEPEAAGLHAHLSGSAGMAVGQTFMVIDAGESARQARQLQLQLGRGTGMAPPVGTAARHAARWHPLGCGASHVTSMLGQDTAGINPQASCPW